MKKASGTIQIPRSLAGCEMPGIWFFPLYFLPMFFIGSPHGTQESMFTQAESLTAPIFSSPTSPAAFDPYLICSPSLV